MTKKQVAFINTRIVEFFRYAQEELAEAKSCDDSSERDEHYLQARLNECAANTLCNLLSDMEDI
uniref:Uncharacterized protein n=1 Tax=Dulem virus 203 TaxID=3145680 RepID=A0AAU8B379_9VIRU